MFVTTNDMILKMQRDALQWVLTKPYKTIQMQRITQTVSLLSRSAVKNKPLHYPRFKRNIAGKSGTSKMAEF